jgi:hypothetical protein
MPLWSGKIEECRMYQMYSIVLCPPLRNRQKLDIELATVEQRAPKVHGLVVKNNHCVKLTRARLYRTTSCAVYRDS